MSWVIDSSGWIEYFSGGTKADKYEKIISASEEKLVPSLVLFEVYKKIKKSIGEENALLAVAQMQKAQVVPFDANLALYAADLSLQYQLAMADAIVYATAVSLKAKLITSDNDFRGLPGVVLV